MNKIWYIYVGGHLGPFNAEEIFRLYYQHQIDDKTFLWRRGEPDWRPLASFPEIYQVLHPELASQLPTAPQTWPGLDDGTPASPPPIPASALAAETGSSFKISTTPLSFEEPLSSSSPSPAAETNADLRQRELPKTAASRAAIKKLMQDDLDARVSERFLGEYLSEQDDTGEEVHPAFRWWHYGLVAMVLALIGGVSAWIWPYFGHPLNIKVSDDFWAVVEAPAAKGILTVLEAKEDFSAVYLGSNVPGRATVLLSLTSLPGQIMANEDIELTAKASYQSGVAIFDTLTMVRGTNLVEGRYTYQIKAVRQSLAQRWSWWKKMWKHTDPALYVGQNDLWAARGEVYLGHAPDFAQRLEAFKAKEEQDQQNWLAELRQRGKTVQTLLGQLDKLGQKEIEKLRQGKDIEHFLQAYQRKIMPVLQAFVEEKNYSLEGELVALEQGLTQIAQQMAAAAMDLEAQVIKQPKIRKVNRQALQEKWQAAIKKIHVRLKTWQEQLKAKEER